MVTQARQSAASQAAEQNESWQRGAETPSKRQDEDRLKKRNDANPYRNLGNALEKWKDRLRVLEAKKDEAHPDDTQEQLVCSAFSFYPVLPHKQATWSTF